MNNKNNIASCIVATLMSFAILFPLVVQFEHLFDEHEHIACSESTSHLHESDFDCDLYDFQISSMDIPSLEQFHFDAISNYAEINGTISSLVSSESGALYYLRGPPTFQQNC